MPADTNARSTVLAWFGGRAPVTGIGKIAAGRGDDGDAASARRRDLIRSGWIAGSFEPIDELAIVATHGDLLTPDVDGRGSTI